MGWARLKSKAAAIEEIYVCHPMLGLPCNRWVDMCSGEQVWRQGRHLNISRKAKLPEVSIAAMWVDHINSETRTGQKTSFKSCCLVFLDCWQYKNLAFQILRGLSLTKTVGCLWQDEVVLLKTLLVFMCVLCVHTRRPEVNSWCFLLLLSTFLGGQSLTGWQVSSWDVPTDIPSCWGDT